MKKNLLKTLCIVISIALISGCAGNKEKQEESKDSTETQQQAVTNQKTIENLKVALLGETNASANYAEFAKKANEEKQPEIAKLFQAASKAEAIHANNHAKVLEKLGVKNEEIKPELTAVKSTLENLEFAIKGETHEFEAMYPEFIKIAEQESVKDAVTSFNWALDTEKKHAGFYTKALALLKEKKSKSIANEYYICPKCGNTFEKGNVDENCGFCMTPKSKYEKI